MLFDQIDKKTYFPSAKSQNYDSCSQDWWKDVMNYIIDKLSWERLQSPWFRSPLYINYLSLPVLSVVPMVVYISLALPLVLVMMTMPNINHCTWNMKNQDMQGMGDKISWSLIYPRGEKSPTEKRTLSGTKDWGKRSVIARPLRLGKRSFKTTSIDPSFRVLLNSLRPHSFLKIFKIQKPHSVIGFW